MSKRFLTPVNLPKGANLPSVGIIGDLFFKTTDQVVYVYTSSGWINQSAASIPVSGLSDVQLSNLADGDVLIYNASLNNWGNQNLVGMLAEMGAITGNAGDYSTQQFTATIDGGSPNTTVFTAVYDGGNESSF